MKILWNKKDGKKTKIVIWRKKDQFYIFVKFEPLWNVNLLITSTLWTSHDQAMRSYWCYFSDCMPRSYFSDPLFAITAKTHRDLALSFDEFYNKNWHVKWSFFIFQSDKDLGTCFITILGWVFGRVKWVFILSIFLTSFLISTHLENEY